jgi:hypothetical protein
MELLATAMAAVFVAYTVMVVSVVGLAPATMKMKAWL